MLFKDYHAEQMKDPAFAREWERLKEEDLLEGYSGEYRPSEMDAEDGVSREII